MSIRRRPLWARLSASPSGNSQRWDSSWNTTKSSAGEMPMTTSRSLPHSWWAPNRMGLDPGVDIFVADDVVLLEIVAGLDLDDLERLAAGIGQAMNAADRDVRGLVLAQGGDLAVERHFG